MSLLNNLEHCLMNDNEGIDSIRVDYDGGLHFSGKLKNILLVPFTVILQTDGDGDHELHRIEFENAQKICVYYDGGRKKVFSA